MQIQFWSPLASESLPHPTLSPEPRKAQWLVIQKSKCPGYWEMAKYSSCPQGACNLVVQFKHYFSIFPQAPWKVGTVGKLILQRRKLRLEGITGLRKITFGKRKSDPLLTQVFQLSVLPGSKCRSLNKDLELQRESILVAGQNNKCHEWWSIWTGPWKIGRVLIASSLCGWRADALHRAVGRRAERSAWDQISEGLIQASAVSNVSSLKHSEKHPF